MGIFSTLYLCVFRNKGKTDEALNFQLRANMLVALIATLVDVGTDIWVLYEWHEKDINPTCFVLGLVFIAFSDLLSTFVYCVGIPEESSAAGFILHLVGLGCLHQFWWEWSSPKPLFKKTKYGLEGFEHFFGFRMIECLLEALPMVILQFWVMIDNERYTTLMVVSTGASLVCVTYPVVAVISSVYKYDILRDVIAMIAWTFDTAMRTLPLLYVLVHFKLAGIVLMISTILSEMVYMALIGSYDTALEYVLIAAMGWTCTFVSIYKIVMLLLLVGEDCSAMKRYVFFETALRSIAAIGISIVLYGHDVIHEWQLGVIVAMTIFTVFMQTMFFSKIGTVVLTNLETELDEVLTDQDKVLTDKDEVVTVSASVKEIPPNFESDEDTRVTDI